MINSGKKRAVSLITSAAMLGVLLLSAPITVSAATVNVSSYSELVTAFSNATVNAKDITDDFVLTADITIPPNAKPLGSVVADSITNPDYTTAQGIVTAYNDNPANAGNLITAPPYYTSLLTSNPLVNNPATPIIDDKLDSGLVTFKGHFDGNGHKISGLSDSLFASIDGASLKNIAFTKVTATANVVAKTAALSTLDNSYAYSLTVTPVTDLTGLTNSGVFSCTGARTKYEFWTDAADSNKLKILEVPDYSASAYHITTADNWNSVAKLINANTLYDTAKYYSGETYILENDITTAMTAASPLITWGIDNTVKFKGIFNGQGYTINAATGKMLFGYTDKADIRNFGAHIGEVSGNAAADFVGGIVGNAANQTVVTNCYFVGQSTNVKFGGIVGTLDNSTIRNCYSRTTTETGGGLANTANAGKFYNSYTTQGAAIYNTGASNNNEFNNCFASASSSGISGITFTPIADMKKANFIPELNKNISGATYVYMNNQTPGISGIGEGKNPGTAPIEYFKVTITAPVTGCEFKVYDGTKYLKDGDMVAKGTVLTFSQKNTIGYVFRSYKVNDSSYAANQYTVNANTTVAADFNVIEVYTITVKTSKGGTVTPTDATVKVNKGDTYTFKIVPDAGYKIKSVNYSGAAIVKSGDYYTTSIMITNTNLDVAFISKSENVTNVEVGQNGNIVSVKSTLDIIDIIDENYGNIFKAPLSATKMVEDNVLAAIKGKDITLILDGGTYTWTIYGKSITSADKSINMEVKLEEGTIPDKYLNQVSAFQDRKQFQLKYDGAFPFTAKLTLNVGEKQAGRYANLLYYNPNKLNLEIVASSKIDKNGNTAFDFNHASEYIIVMADKSLTRADLSQAAGSFQNSSPLLSGTRSSMIIAAFLLIAAVAGAGVVFTIIKKHQDI